MFAYCNDGFLNPLLSRWRSCQPTICQSQVGMPSNDGLVYSTLRREKNKTLSIPGQCSLRLFPISSSQLLRTVFVVTCFSMSSQEHWQYMRNHCPKPKVQHLPPLTSATTTPSNSAKITKKKKEIPPQPSFSLTTVHKLKGADIGPGLGADNLPRSLCYPPLLYICAVM